MNTRTKFFALILLTLTFCTIPAAAQSLPEGEWRLTSFKFKQKVEFPPDKQEITMNIREDAKLGGTSGCNVYGGTYALEEGKLKITDIISTMMACGEPSMEFENGYKSTLTAASEYFFKEGVLTLIDPKTGDFLRFEHVEKSVGPKRKTNDR